MYAHMHVGCMHLFAYSCMCIRTCRPYYVGLHCTSVYICMPFGTCVLERTCVILCIMSFYLCMHALFSHCVVYLFIRCFVYSVY